jgi:hypothetical protein
MKYVITVFATAVIVFLAATIYYKGFPSFISPSGVSVVSTEESTLPTTVPTDQPLDEEANLAVIIKNMLVAKYGSASANLNVNVYKIEGIYAEGTAAESGGGGGWFAVKVNGVWKLVWDGNGQIDCNNIAPYPDFPKSMIPECWNSTTDKLVIR